MLVKYEMRLQMSASAKATKYPLCYDWFLCCNSLNLIKKFCVWCQISSKISCGDSMGTDNTENKLFLLIQSKSTHPNISEKCELLPNLVLGVT